MSAEEIFGKLHDGRRGRRMPKTPERLAQLAEARKAPKHKTSRAFRLYDRQLTRRAVQEVARSKIIVGAGVEKALELEAEGKTQTEIAQVLGSDQPMVSRVLARFRDTRKLAKFRLHASADQMATHAITAAAVAAQKGDGALAMELLDRLDVVNAKRRESQAGPQVMVVVGRADPSALPDFSVMAQVPPETHDDSL